jgi:hypothetical protein
MASSKTINQIQLLLAERFPQREKPRKIGGKPITFIPWYETIAIMNGCADGCYDYEIIEKGHSPISNKFEMTVRVTIHASDGTYYREGTGIEDSSTDNFGDYQSNAESMALRRALAKFNLGIYIYRKG